MRGRLSVLAAGVVLVCAVQCPAASATAWGTGVQAVPPANAGANPVVDVGSVSCPAAGSCTAVGTYTDESGHEQGLLLGETSGVWRTGFEVGLPAVTASNPNATIHSVSCTAVGSCSAVGTYTDSSNDVQGLLLSETSGAWGAAEEMALPAGAAANPEVTLEDVSCASTGNCVAVGYYKDSSNAEQGLLVSETSGAWAPAVRVSLPAGAGADPLARIESVSCPSAGDCSAVGFYRETSGAQQGVLLSEASGVWTAEKAALPTGATDNVYVYGISCPSAGECAAVGHYNDSSDHEQGLLLSESGGTWRVGVTASPPADVGPNPEASFFGNGVSCAAPGDCSAVGDYVTYLGTRQGVLLSETGGMWAPGVEVQPPANASSNPGVALGSVSCPSVGNCAAVGFYTDSAAHEQGLLLSEGFGAWEDGIEAGLPTPGPNPSVYPESISCASVGNCSAVGYYVDSSHRDQGLLLDTQHVLTISQTGAGAGTVTSSDGTVNCAACVHAYTEGSAVTLAATPAAGSTFAGWSGAGCTGTGTCSVTMSSDQSVTANFGVAPAALKASGPVLSALRVSPHRFALAGRRVNGRCVKASKRNAKDRRCTRRVRLAISYQLSASASVTITIARVHSGRLVNGRCRKPTRKNRRHRACVRTSAVRGVLTERGEQGTNTFAFNGLIGGHELTAGSYRLTATPSPAGQSGTPRTTRFTIAK